MCTARSQTAGGGDRLLGSYIDNRHLSGEPVTQRVEAQVDFDWVMNAPPGLSDPDEFSARWTGELQSQYTEPNTFYVDSDDGARVWLNEHLIIDNWMDGPCPEAGETVNLAAGQRYLLRYTSVRNGPAQHLLSTAGGHAMKVAWAARFEVPHPARGFAPGVFDAQGIGNIPTVK
jgi:hypothetical protein